MELLAIGNQVSQELLTNSQQLEGYVRSFFIGAVIFVPLIFTLIGIIWNQSVKRADKAEAKAQESDDKIDILTTQITRLATLIEENIFPATNHNTTEINSIKVTCAGNHPKRSKS